MSMQKLTTVCYHDAPGLLACPSHAAARPDPCFMLFLSVTRVLCCFLSVAHVLYCFISDPCFILFFLSDPCFILFSQ